MEKAATTLSQFIGRSKVTWMSVAGGTVPHQEEDGLTFRMGGGVVHRKGSGGGKGMPSGSQRASVRETVMGVLAGSRSCGWKTRAFFSASHIQSPPMAGSMWTAFRTLWGSTS